MNVAQVPAQYIDMVWPMVAPMIDRAVAHTLGQYRLDDIRQEISSGTRQLWIGNRGAGIDALCTTKVVIHPGKRSLYVSFAVGSLDAIEHFWPRLKEYAKQWGCGLIIAQPRRGFGRSGALPREFKHVSDIWMAEVD